MKTLIRNGLVVSAENTEKSDILIDGERIVKTGTIDTNDCIADITVDASGRYIFPGGVDPHVHMHLPGPSGYSADDFITGSKAALAGGTTTLLDFVTPSRGESLTTALSHRMEEAAGSLADYSFHVSPVEWRNTTSSEMAECIRTGITSFKIYMAYKNSIGLDDNAICKVLETAGKAGALVTAHCEEGDEIEALKERLFREGKRDPLYHSLSRPGNTETEAIARLIRMADKYRCRLYIVHVSAAGSPPIIREAKSRGVKVYAETCPHYLLLNDSRYEGKYINTSQFVMSPPLRGVGDNEELWKGIAEETIDTIGTDHCPFTIAQKMSGINDFRLIPNGAGGVEHRLALLYTYGVMTGRISVNRMVDLFSTTPAKIFGLYPRKGEIMEGSDADIVIWDPETSGTISAADHIQNCDTEIYEGFRTTGIADYVIKRGVVVARNNKIIREDIKGAFLPRRVQY